MNTGYRNQRAQQKTPSAGPGWALLCVVIALTLGMIALPWIILGILAERALMRWLHWKLSFLVWLILLFICAFLLYGSYQHGLQVLIFQELDAYIHAAKHYQTDFLHWPLRALWSETVPVWLRSWQSIGIVGFCAELFIQRRNDTTQTLRQNEQRRRQRMQRSQRQAKRRSIRPGSVPDALGGMMMIGVPIDDELEGE